MSKPQKELYEFSRFSLDVSERLLRRDGKRVPLTDKAFDTLCVLVKRGGELVGKSQLMDEVWADSIVEENNLDQKISMLRQALGERSGKEKFIETVRGHGYRFLPEVRRVEIEPMRPDLGTLPEVPRPPKSDSAPPPVHYETQRTGNVVAVAKWQREEEEPESSEQPGVHRVESYPVSLPIGFFERNKKAAAFLVVGLAVTAVAVFAISRFYVGQPKTAGVPIDSIAVLPFENATQDANAEYLSEGISESLINRLSRLSNLKVMSSGSVIRYKGVKPDIQKVGTELNVKSVLTGSVRQSGDQIVISVSLDDASDNHRIWGEQYVRTFADVLSVQNDIVQEVSNNLRIKLTVADNQQLAKRYTENVEAYQFYLKGQYAWNKLTEEDLRKAIEYYDRAVELDPNYALAYSGLANCFGVLGNSYLPPREAFPQAKVYATKALELDDSLIEAHGSMAAIRLFYDWDWVEAEKELNRSISIDPDNAETYDIFSAYWDTLGRPQQALEMSKRGMELEPLSLLMNTNVGNDYYYSRQYDEAALQLEKTIDLEPRYFRAYAWLGQAYEQKKMYSEAINTFQKGMAETGRDPQLLSLLGHTYAISGDSRKAREILGELQETAKKRYISPYLIAVVYLGMGDKDQTFALLERAYQDRSSWLLWLKVEPKFDPLRDDRRFQDLLRRLGGA